jgi:arsenite-transporting ATPase
MRLIFVLGKGGVGKTTVSALLALRHSKLGKTLVASLDPAHNLGDVFQEKLGMKEKRIADNLYAMEVDLDKVVRDYIGELENSLKHTYRYLTVINLEKYFDVLKNYPGVEESALLEAMRKIIKKDYDTIIFDTPPTGLTLRILSLAEMTLIWLDKLIEIRKKILDRRKAVEKIQGELCVVIDGERYEVPSSEEDDAVIREMYQYRDEIEDFIHMIRNNSVSEFIAVMNPEPLSFYETKRIIEYLQKIDIGLSRVIVNKSEECDFLGEIEREFSRYQIFKIPVMKNPVGIENIRKICEYLGDA